MHHSRIWLLLIALTAALTASGCGSSSSGSSSNGSASPAGSGSAATTGTSPSSSSNVGPGALSADARSAATGDIPDNQVFLTFSAAKPGFSVKYPEGWTRVASGQTVSFRDKNNLVRILVGHGAAPTVASVRTQLASLRSANPRLTFTAPTTVTLTAGPAIKARYTTQSAPDQVTGRRVKLIVDRYVLSRGGRVAVLDLGTPVGVDNVDAYKMMAESFRWR